MEHASLQTLSSPETWREELALPGRNPSIISKGSDHGGQKKDQRIAVSVVIPTYRRVKLLTQCIEALLRQDLPKFLYEIIVVSDGPDEDTKALIHSFKHLHPFLYCLHLPQKRGPAAARNLGWQNASGKLIAFTDDDCLPDRNWLSSFYSVYNAISVRCHTITLTLPCTDSEIAFTGKIIVPLSARPTDYEKNTSHLATAEFVTANCCCTRSALENVNGFDEQFSMAWREDSDLEFKFLRQNIPIQKIDEAVVVHPVRKAKWGVSIKEQKKGIFNALLYKKFPQLYRKKIQPTPSWNYYMITLAFGLLIVAGFLHLQTLSIVFAIVWLSGTIHFIIARLKGTAKTLDHVTEMIVTSFIIPFVSVYWQIYGSIKYKAFFL